jgi:hypothetical protein
VDGNGFRWRLKAWMRVGMGRRVLKKWMHGTFNG